MVTLKVRQNGSILVEGEDVKLIDWNGNEYFVPKKPFAVCRCGASKEKPFCDSSHKECQQCISTFFAHKRPKLV